MACGGTRYTADFLAAIPDAGGVEVTPVDQDVAACEYCRTSSLRTWAAKLMLRCIPIKRLAEEISRGEFDVVCSAGLFDYLDEGAGR